MAKIDKSGNGFPRFWEDPNRRGKRAKETSQSGSILQRRIKVLTFLQAGHHNLESLSNLCAVHPRTIQRDLDELRKCGCVITFKPEENRFVLSSELFLPANFLTRDEALALVTLCLEIGDQDQIPFLDSLESAASKLVCALPDATKTFLKEVGGLFRIRRDPVNPLTHSKPIFNLLQEEYVKRRSVRIVYKPPRDPEPIRTLLSPYSIFFSRRSWYVIGRSSIHSQVRTFHLGRILSLETTEHSYEVPRGFSLKQYQRNAWHMIPEPGPDSHVVVRFSEKVGQNVAEVSWHPTQQIVPLDDGGIEFHATVSGIHEISWWILGYGKEAEVLAPKSLRTLIRSHVESLSATYRTSAPAPERPKRPKRPRVDLPDWDAETSDD